MLLAGLKRLNDTAIVVKNLDASRLTVGEAWIAASSGHQLHELGKLYGRVAGELMKHASTLGADATQAAREGFAAEVSSGVFIGPPPPREELPF